MTGKLCFELLVHVPNAIAHTFLLLQTNKRRQNDGILFVGWPLEITFSPRRFPSGYQSVGKFAIQLELANC